MPETGSTLKNLLLLSWVLVVVSRPAFSQHSDPALETITVDRGMQTNVRCVIQDKIGYLWFGTWNSLYRHDGHSFVPFRYDIDDTSSLAENLVFALYGHKAGVLWAGTGVGLEKFDRTTSTFQHYVPIHRVPKNMPATMLLQFVKTTMVSFGLGLHGVCFNLTKQQAHSQLCDMIQQIPGAYSTTG
jgi:ligand-binding sensor domain-containing protein